MRYYIKDQHTRVSSCEVLDSQKCISDSDTNTAEFPNILSREDNLELLKNVLSLEINSDKPDPTSPQTVFLSIDTEGSRADKNNPYITEIGISVLDTSTLLSDTGDAKPSIVSYNFQFPGEGRTSIKLRRPFIFGKSHVQHDIERFFDLFSTGRYNTDTMSRKCMSQRLWPRDCRLVVVGHHIKTDMLLINSIVGGFWESLQADAVIDLAQVFGNVRLRGILEDLQIGAYVSQRWLHCAGNDAQYTLRALLLSAIRNLEIPEAEIDLDLNMVERIRNIAYENIPDITRGRKWDSENTKRGPRKRKAKKIIREAAGYKGPYVNNMAEALEQMQDGWSDILYG